MGGCPLIRIAYRYYLRWTLKRDVRRMLRRHTNGYR